MTAKPGRFAYLIVADLPGSPIKAGISAGPRRRFYSIDNASPFNCRLLGITIDGMAREKDLLAAMRPLKREWGYATPELFALVRSYIEAGEWFVPVEDAAAHFEAAEVNRRLRERGVDYTVKLSDFDSYGQGGLIQWLLRHDPLLALDWAGFVQSDEFPCFHGSLEMAA